MDFVFITRGILLSSVSAYSTTPFPIEIEEKDPLFSKVAIGTMNL